MRKGLGLPLGQVIMLLTLPLLAYLGFSAGKKALEAYALWQQAETLRLEIEELKAHNAELRRHIDYLRSDAYVEKAARENLDLIKPGDVAIVVLYPTPVAAATPAAPAATAPPRSLAQIWSERLSSYLHDLIDGLASLGGRLRPWSATNQ